MNQVSRDRGETGSCRTVSSAPPFGPPPEMPFAQIQSASGSAMLSYLAPGHSINNICPLAPGLSESWYLEILGGALGT